MTRDGIGAAGGNWQDMAQDRSKFQAFTVYFDFDSSVVKGSEKTKTESIASEFKACPPACALLIEGHCDERGTVEYNRALGERRAQSLREVLTAAGIQPDRIHTVSFGKDKPVALGQDEASYTMNRRGEFILLSPK
jgi:peptidoglycan-associated lipoprotein